MAKDAVDQFAISIRKSCVLFSVSETCFRYQPKLVDENKEIADKLLELVENDRNWGFMLCFLHLRNVLNKPWNHKRVYRIYCELELNLRIKPRKRLDREVPVPLAVPDEINECWSIDFMHDQLSDGRSTRLFNVLDDCNREALAIDAGLSMPADRVIRSLNQIFEWRGKPKIIRCDNGPEFISHRFQNWAVDNGIEISYIQPGNPQQNAYIERFNRTVRYDWLSQHLFRELSDLQSYADNWLWRYNNIRPNMGIGGITPMQKLEQLNKERLH
jgi:putative transposase